MTTLEQKNSTTLNIQTGVPMDEIENPSNMAIQVPNLPLTTPETTKAAPLQSEGLHACVDSQIVDLEGKGEPNLVVINR